MNREPPAPAARRGSPSGGRNSRNARQDKERKIFSILPSWFLPALRGPEDASSLGRMRFPVNFSKESDEYEVHLCYAFPHGTRDKHYIY